MALNDLKLQKIRLKNDRFELSDGKGLSIRVSPTGKKTWVFRYMIDGTARRMTFGTYPTISLSEVREKHSLAMQDIERGIDPGHKKKEANATMKAAPTVADLLEEFSDKELNHTKSGKERKRLISKDVLPVWGTRKVNTITRRDAVLLVDRVRDRAPIAANRLQSVIVRMFNFAAERGILEHSPLTGMKKKTEQPRQRVLTDKEISLLWAALDLKDANLDIYHVTKLALKMILLSGQRPGEVCGMAWDEIMDGTWIIPAERMKGGVEHIVPLSSMALDIIEQARIYSGQSRFVFASPHKADSHLMTHTLSKAVIRHWQEIGLEEQFTPHDLRRTLRTRLAELGVDDVVAERVLGHKLQGIMAVYNRHGYVNEKRMALDKWQRKLQRILGIEEGDTGKIIELKKFVSRR